MSPGICVTSFRMLLMRRSDLGYHILSRGIRTTSAAAAAAVQTQQRTTVGNSWNTITLGYGRNYSSSSGTGGKSDSDCSDIDDLSQGKTNKEKASALATSHLKKGAEAKITAASIDDNSDKNEKCMPQLPKSEEVHILNENSIHDNLKDNDLTQLKVAQLKGELRAHGLSTAGRKDILINRLQDYLQHNNNDNKKHEQPQQFGEHDLAIGEKTQAEIMPAAASSWPTPSTSAASSSSASLPSSSESSSLSSSTFGTTETVKTLSASSQSATPSQSPAPSALPTNNLSTSATMATSKRSDIDAEIEDKNIRYSEPKHSIKLVDYDQNDDDDDDTGIHTVTSTPKVNYNGDVFIEYIQGLPHLTVPLPSRREKCRFALKPVSHKVGDLIEMLKTEDHGIDRVTVLNNCGVRIASTCNVDSLMDEPFWLYVNDKKYEVIPPKRERIKLEDLHKLGDVRSLIAQLYEALHVGEYHIHKEQELVTKLETLKYQLSPMEMEKAELSRQAARKSTIVTWVGLGLMSMQFGILARLTWWEYSWDIMEPVTYFVTYGTTMAMYAYYCITKKEYTFMEVSKRQYLFNIHKRAKKKNFDVEEYNNLKRQISELEFDLRRLRDPINLQLPPHIDRSQNEPKPPEGSGRTSSVVSSSKKSSSGFRLPFFESKN